MRNKFTYICLASALALNTACQDENLVKEDGKSLSFSVSYASGEQPKAQSRSVVEFTDEDGVPTPFDITLSVEDTYAEPIVTRGTPIKNISDFTNTVKEFRAWGYYNGAAWTSVNGSKVKQYAGADYRPVDGSDNEINAYNPSATDFSKYRFYAIYPYDNTELSNRGASVTTSNKDGLTISYTSPDDGDADAVAQKEVLAGYMKETNSMALVPIAFKPILAAIQFRVSDKQLGRDVKINSIELHTLSKTGTCNVTKDGVTWSNLGAQNTTFVQTFDFDVTESEKGKDINDNEHTKTFFIIPQKGSSNRTDGTRIIINYSQGGVPSPKPGVHLLYGQEFEAGKTYIYNVGNFEDPDVTKEPWVEFSEFDVNDTNLLGTTNEIHEENNSKFLFDFAQRNGTYEKTYFKIHNLEVGHWYSIEFTENLSLVGKTDTPFGNVGTYACRVDEGKNTLTTQASMLAYYTDLANPPFIWEHPNNIYNKTAYASLLSEGKTAKLTFKATATEMWWQWDYSRGDDGRTLRAEIYMPSPGQTIPYYDYKTGTTTNKTFITGEKIKDITPESDVPTVDFLNATIYNCAHSGGNYGNSSMKTYAVDATAGASPVDGTLFFRVINEGYGRINIPLTYLDPSKTYRITYTLDKTGTTSTRTGNNYGLGYVLQTTANTAGTTFNPTTNANYEKSLRGEGTKATFSVTKSFEFTPTASTMYWVWDFSEFATGNADSQFVTFKDVTIEEVTP